ncbi:MAG: hypothetical protein RLY31_2854 [Bacteroidota bacterium]|jgi:N-acetyl-gamma-glutamyl-phosphate reductase
MIDVGIIGGAGYTAGELLRLLVFHPAVKIRFVQSSSQAGSPVHQVHRDLEGLTDLRFTPDLPQLPDVLFLCSGHGKSADFLARQALPDSVRIIDLSSDFRLGCPDNGFVYGLPELSAPAIRSAHRIANPGCFATAIELALLPLVREGWIRQAVHVHAITGATGAGQQPTETTHFSWRDNNVSLYKPFRHQHLAEIRMALRQVSPSGMADILFVPIRGNFSRGIFASLYTDVQAELPDIQSVYQDFYKEAPFTRVSRYAPALKQVVQTNHCILHLEKIEGKLLITSILDNLLKGAAGQAVQNMNLLFGLPQPTGLQLKPAGF